MEIQNWKKEITFVLNFYVHKKGRKKSQKRVFVSTKIIFHIGRKQLEWIQNSKFLENRKNKSFINCMMAYTGFSKLTAFSLCIYMIFSYRYINEISEENREDKMIAMMLLKE